MLRPTLIAHADWSIAPAKRWLCRAELRTNGHYRAYLPEKAGEVQTLLARLVAGSAGALLLGFDFPIGLPARYAEQAGIDDFLTVLPRLGSGEWSDFYNVAGHPDEISLRRPFYPLRPGNARHEHLLRGLNLEGVEDLRRQCDLARPGRRAAAPLFWTLGGQQVGKAAISGWRDLLGPTIRTSTLDLALWPFAGSLVELCRPGRIVVAETYPAECYTHLGISFRASPGRKSGKRVQADRRANGPKLLAWAGSVGLELAPRLRAVIADGFGTSREGEDQFDAVVGLFGILNIVLGHRAAGEPADPRIRRMEGWILGQI